MRSIFCSISIEPLSNASLTLRFRTLGPWDRKSMKNSSQSRDSEKPLVASKNKFHIASIPFQT
jgi:hypothetical protein